MERSVAGYDLMQYRHLHGLNAIGDLFRGSITDVRDLDTKGYDLAGQGVIAVNRQLAIFDPCNRKFP